MLCGAGIVGVACPTEMTTGEAQAADETKSNVPPTMIRQDLHEVQDEIAADAISAVLVDVLMDGIDRLVELRVTDGGSGSRSCIEPHP